MLISSNSSAMEWGGSVQRSGGGFAENMRYNSKC